MTSEQATGILPCQHLRDAVSAGIIQGSPAAQQIQPSSLDLRLGAVAYQVQAGFLPGKTASVAAVLDRQETARLDISLPTVFAKNHVYIVPLQESLNLPAGMSAKANPKSTTGRLDIFTRLITDYGTAFDRVPAGYQGRLYAEISPRSFSIQVRTGLTLNQLRLFQGTPMLEDKALRDLHRRDPIVYAADGSPDAVTVDNGLTLALDLEVTNGIVGYVARDTDAVIDLEKVAHYAIEDFWYPIYGPTSGEFIIEPDRFYILASKQKIRIPPDCAAEMIPFDPVIGEFRAHYAGFFDPGFGNTHGTRAVLEVKAHYVPFFMRHGQVVARLVYERMLTVPDTLYGPAIGSSYYNQGVTLSKHFR